MHFIFLSILVDWLIKNFIYIIIIVNCLIYLKKISLSTPNTSIITFEILLKVVKKFFSSLSWHWGTLYHRKVGFYVLVHRTTTPTTLFYVTARIYVIAFWKIRLGCSDSGTSPRSYVSTLQILRFVKSTLRKHFVTRQIYRFMGTLSL